ncbi:Hypothetical predicted protein, partial [Olea europaea subsp. europaea]
QQLIHAQHAKDTEDNRPTSRRRKRQSNLKYADGRPNLHAQHPKRRSPREALTMIEPTHPIPEMKISRRGTDDGPQYTERSKI